MRLASLSLPLVVLCAGCSGPRPPPFCFGPMPAGANPNLVLTGTRVSLEFRFESSCEVPTSIEASVLDAQSRAVMSTASLDARIGTVSFTPTTAGSHHVVARFQPNLGLIQADVTVAQDRSAEPGLTLPGHLDTPLELSDGGLLVTGVGAYVLSGGAPVFLTPSMGAPALRGEVVWGRNLMELSRYLLGARADGGPQLVATPAEALAVRESFAPSEDDVVTWDSNSSSMALYTLTADGGWHRRNLVGSGSPVQWAHRVGDQFISYSQNGEECVHDLFGDAGRATCRQPMPAYLSYLGGDLEGFWLTDSVGEVLGYHGPGTSTLEARVFNPGTTSAGGGELVPAADGFWPVVKMPGFNLVPVLSGGVIGFEYWGPGLESASRRTVVTRGDGGLLIRRR